MIAVIGHGRSPEGKSWGVGIDSCNTVIRCWDWQWQPVEDYGGKYDYGLFMLTPKGLRLFQDFNARRPTRGWLAYMGKPTSGGLPDGTTLLDTSRWVQIAQEEFGGRGETNILTLTRGCVAAAWAIEYAIPNEPVVLVGFDNVKIGVNQPIDQSFCPEYWELYNSRFAPGKAEKTYPIGTARTATHDMSVEKPLLELLAKRNRAELRFAEDVW
jgi:hypothetical protein